MPRLEAEETIGEIAKMAQNLANLNSSYEDLLGNIRHVADRLLGPTDKCGSNDVSGSHLAFHEDSDIGRLQNQFIYASQLYAAIHHEWSRIRAL